MKDCHNCKFLEFQNINLKKNFKLFSKTSWDVIKEQEKQLEDLKKQLEEKDEKINDLEKKVKEFENLQTNQPSSQKPCYTKPNIDPTTHKKSGQKKGHIGISRKSPEIIDQIIKRQPCMCSFCNSKNVVPIKEKNQRSKIITDIEIKTINKKEILQNVKCLDCGKITKAQYSNKSRSPFGENIHSLITYLNSVCGTTLNPIKKLFNELFNLKISKSSISNRVINTSKKLLPIYNSYLDKIKESNFSHKDETSYRVKGKTFWIWIYDNIKTVFYRLANSRSKEVIQKDFYGYENQISINDGYTTYRFFNKYQLCWAHLLREAKQHYERDKATDEEKFFYFRLRDIYHRAKEFSLLRSCSKMRLEFEKEVIELMIEIKNRTKFLTKFFKRLDKEISRLFLFVEIFGLPPTNNQAEQSLRPIVIHRKMSFGSWSEDGGNAKVILKTIYENFKRQKICMLDVFDYVS